LESHAFENGGTGFLAVGPGSCLITSDYCRSERNQGHGFSSQQGGQMQTGVGCTAAGNHLSGFASCGPRALLIAREGCSSRGNLQYGFHAANQGQLTAGNGCWAPRKEGKAARLPHSCAPWHIYGKLGWRRCSIILMFFVLLGGVAAP
jgi:hypothetical protein